MRFEWLFLRWLVLILVIALGIAALRGSRPRNPASQYRKVMLLQSGNSVGLALAGIAVDPQKREVQGLLGRPGETVPAPFFILWCGENGETFGATFDEKNGQVTGLCKVSPSGEMQTLQDFRSQHDSGDLHASVAPDQELLSIWRALPPDAAFHH